MIPGGRIRLRLTIPHGIHSRARHEVKARLSPSRSNFQQERNPMAMDVTFENEQGFTTGSVDAGVKMTDAAKPAPSAPPQPAPTDPEAAKRAFQSKLFPQPSEQPASGSQPQPASGAWPSTPEGAQALINRLMDSPKFRADYANSNNPERAKL